MTDLKDLLTDLNVAIENDNKEAIKRLLKKIVEAVRNDESRSAFEGDIIDLISCINPFNEIKDDLKELFQLYIDRNCISNSLIDSLIACSVNFGNDSSFKDLLSKIIEKSKSDFALLWLLTSNRELYKIEEAKEKLFDFFINSIDSIKDDNFIYSYVNFTYLLKDKEKKLSLIRKSFNYIEKFSKFSTYITLLSEFVRDFSNEEIKLIEKSIDFENLLDVLHNLAIEGSKLSILQLPDSTNYPVFFYLTSLYSQLFDSNENIKKNPYIALNFVKKIWSKLKEKKEFKLYLSLLSYLLNVANTCNNKKQLFVDILNIAITPYLRETIFKIGSIMLDTRKVKDKSKEDMFASLLLSYLAFASIIYMEEREKLNLLFNDESIKLIEEAYNLCKKYLKEDERKIYEEIINGKVPYEKLKDWFNLFK